MSTTATTSTNTSQGFATLPPALRNSALQRLAFVGTMLLAALVLSEIVHWLQVLVNGTPPLWANCWTRMAMLALTWMARTRMRDERLPPERRLLVARAWIVLSCLGVVYLEYRALPAGAALAAAGISRGCLPVMLAPVLIPDSLRRSLRFSALLLLTFPAGYFLSRLTGGAPQSSTEIWVRITNDLIVMGAAWTTAATVHQLREAVSEKFGSYRLVRKLGEGGFGEVWEARHKLLQRPAALKLISPSLHNDIHLQRFLREAETLSGLQCPHTVRLFDYGRSEDGTFYLAMELLQGLDLDLLVKTYGPQPPERVASLLAQVCLSLQEAHGQGLIHRDIKPANLFVCHVGLQADFIKVLDFGLVKNPSKGDLTQSDQVLGTPDYMAPESIMGQPADGRTDLYSLGGVGYWLLTGTPLFQREQPMQVLMDHLNSPPPPLNVAHPVAEQIMACLAKDPAQRPLSAAVLYAELSRQPQWDNQQSSQWWANHKPMAK
ncbi:serine/threonine protein kinase [bacterium]|nr:serine/threonine protein kinase [bacterium]